MHHNCISMIVSRFTTFTENFEICCNQITKISCTKYDSANASSAWGLVILSSDDLAISVFREMNINTVFTKMWALKILHEKNWRVSSGTLSSTRYSLNSCSHSGVSE